MAKRNGGIIGPSNVPTGQYGGTAKGVWRLRDAFNYIKAGLWPVAGNYPVGNSLRFNSGSSDNLTRTPASAGNRRTFTLSAWVKRSKLGITTQLFGASTTAPDELGFNTSDQLRLYIYNNTSSTIRVSTQVFRDVSAWYHILIAFDTTNATAQNRCRVYVNGTEITTWTTNNTITQNLDVSFNNNIINYIGRDSSGEYFDGYMSETYLIDGQQLTPSSFGQTDSATGIWTPLPYTGTYGTNGFYLKFANSAALGTDSSGNGNTWTANNLTSVDQSTDTPTNNFATGNPLDVNGMTFTEGNLLAASTGATWKSARGTIGMSQGKWFWEMKATASASSFDGQIGVGLFSLAIASFGEWTTANPYVVYSAGDGLKWVNGVSSAYGATWTVGDIIGVAFDADNLTITFYKNGSSQGTITTGWSADTYAVEIALYGRSGGTTSGSYNFGNPPYTANGYTDGAGYGNFSYAVPSGYYALNTKNLANFG